MNRLDRPQFPSIPSHNSILSPQLHFNGKIRKTEKRKERFRDIMNLMQLAAFGQTLANNERLDQLHP